jgi:hypothetical protein
MNSQMLSANAAIKYNIFNSWKFRHPFIQLCTVLPFMSHIRNLFLRKLNSYLIAKKRN